METLFLYVFLPVFLLVVFLRVRGLEKKIKHLDSQSTQDELTGVLNLRGGNQIIRHHHAVLTRKPCEKNNFAILNLDLNRFKGINDKYGHKVGDHVLKFFSEVLTRNLRTHGYDTVIRVGGDEFVILLPGSSALQAEAVKEKIKSALIAEPFEQSGLKLSLSTSIGFATALMKNGMVLSIDQIMHAADTDMYIDKKLPQLPHNDEVFVDEKRH